MKLSLFELLNEEHIYLNLEAKDGHDAIRQINELLVASGHTDPGYAEDVWAREDTFPTGLPTEPHAVAIPHADPDHIHQSAVCFATLKETVPFHQMGTDSSAVLQIRVIILLAIKEREKQAELIAQVVALIQDGDFLTALLGQPTAQDAYLLIHGTLTEESGQT